MQENCVLKKKKKKRKENKKKHVLDELHSDMSYSDIGCEFNINESIIHVK